MVMVARFFFKSWAFSNCFQFQMMVLLPLLLLLFNNNYIAECGNIVKTLPGFEGPLPFKLETGYIGIEDSELFYYFIESTGKPRNDPLLLYLVGGPGCSALNGLFFQTGPLAFKETEYSEGLPQLILREYAWTKISSIIFIDAPVGTGFSYATTSEGYYMTDTKSAQQSHIFLKKWLIEHPAYIWNKVYIATDSYSGILAPIISQYILDDNAAGIQPNINLIGFISGSPHINTAQEYNSKIPFARNMALISDQLYQVAKENCNGWYYEVDPSNAKCVEALQPISQCLDDISTTNILEPKCVRLSAKSDDKSTRRILKEIRRFTHLNLNRRTRDWCHKNLIYYLSVIWANNKSVQDALYVRKGTVKQWFRCNLTLTTTTYYSDVEDGIPFLKNLTKTSLQILLYTGDHDMVIPHLSTEDWLRSLNISVDIPWTPWFVNGQVAGYRVVYANAMYRLNFATLKGSGHSPTEYFPARCFHMFDRWINFVPL